MANFFYDNFSDHFFLSTSYKRKLEINPLGAFPGLPFNNMSRLVIGKKMINMSPLPSIKYCVKSCYLKPFGIRFHVKKPGEVPLLMYSFDRDIDFSLVKGFYAYVQVFDWFSSLRVVLLDVNQNVISIFQNTNIPLFRKILKIDFTRSDNNPLVNTRFLKFEIVTSCKTTLDLYFIGASYRSVLYDNFTFLQSLSNGLLSTIAITDNSSSSNNRTLSLTNTGSLGIFLNSDPYNTITNSPAGLSFYVTITASVLYKNINITPGNRILYIPLFISKIVGDSFSIVVDDSSGNVLGSSSIISTGFTLITIPLNNTTIINNLRIVIQNDSTTSANSILFQANPTFPTFLINNNTLSPGLIEGLIFFLYLI